MKRPSKIRFIGVSNEGDEQITFTEDFESPSSDWCPNGYSVYTDAVIEMNLPDMFPIESTFRKAF